MTNSEEHTSGREAIFDDPVVVIIFNLQLNGSNLFFSLLFYFLIFIFLFRPFRINFRIKISKQLFLIFICSKSWIFVNYTRSHRRHHPHSLLPHFLGHHFLLGGGLPGFLQILQTLLLHLSRTLGLPLPC